MFLSLFKGKDPAEQQKEKFAEIEQSLGNDLEAVILGKAAWLTNRGVYYGKRKRYKEAMQDFESALELKSDYLPAHFGIADTYKAMGKMDEAAKAFESAPDEMKDSEGNVIASKEDVLH